jgi:hypothetical protein
LGSIGVTLRGDQVFFMKVVHSAKVVADDLSSVPTWKNIGPTVNPQISHGHSTVCSISSNFGPLNSYLQARQTDMTQRNMIYRGNLGTQTNQTWIGLINIR